MVYSSIVVVAMCALLLRQVSAWSSRGLMPKSIGSMTRLQSTWSSNQQYNKQPNRGASPSQTSNNFGSNANDADGDDVKTFASYSVYKGKAALCVKPIPPTFQNVSKTSRTISREGSIFLEFAPAGNGPREYNWAAKSIFSLDATECGALLIFDPSKGAEFTHDPKMGTPEAGQVMKRLALAASPDGKGVFFRLTATDKEKGKTDTSVLLTWAELEVIKSIVRYSIPFMLGIDKLLNINGPSESQ